MAKSTAVKKMEPVAAAPVEEIEKPEIIISATKSQRQLYGYGKIPDPCVIILQEHLSLEDALKPETWKKVQRTENRLARWQSVTVVENDGRRALIQWTVTDANENDGVTLKPPGSLAVTGDQLGSDWIRDDGCERVSPYALGGWVRTNLQSGHQVGDVMPTRQSAIIQSENSRPRPVMR